MTNEIRIPNKSLFKLDEVCSLTNVKPYVLRFWESEFEQISPILSSTGQKLFEHKDIEAVIYAKELLFEKKMTIENAKFELDKIYMNAKDILEEPVKEVTPVKKGLGPRVSVDLEKINEASNLLRGIISTTQSIQASHNWQ